MSLFAGSLTTRKLFNGGLFNDGLFYSANGEIFHATLTTTLVPSIGNYVPTFTRSTTASVTDFEGIIRTAKIGEARFEGARRVENLYANSETLVTQGISVDAGTYTVSFTGTGTITFSGAYSGSLVGTGVSNRVETTFSASAGTLTSTVSGSVLTAQCENVTGQAVQSASEYVSNGVLSFPYHGTGADGVKYFWTQRDGTPITPVTQKGYLSEGQIQNLVTYSEQMDNASWVKSSVVSVTANNAQAPDGTTTADLFLRTTTSALEAILRKTCSQTINTIYTFSVYAKKLTVNWVRLRNLATDSSFTLLQQSAFFDLDGGVLGTKGSGILASGMQSIGNGWYRCWITALTSASIPNNYVDIAIATADNTINGISGDSIYVWGAQLEKGVSSYIKTTSSSITRNKDDLKFPLILPEEGSIYAEVSSVTSNVGSGIVSKELGVGPINYHSDTGVSFIDGTNTHVLTYGSPFSTGTRKIAARWSGTAGTMKVFKDGGASPEGAYNGAFVGGSEILIGQNNFFGHIGNVKIWNRVLSDSELMSMTS